MSLTEGTSLKEALTWYQNTSDSALLDSYTLQPDLTKSMLTELLGEEEASELILDLDDYAGAEEGIFSTKINPDYPEIFFLHGIMGAHLAHHGFFENRLWLDAKELVKGNLAERLSLQADESDRGGLDINPDGHIKMVYNKATRRWRKAGFKVHQIAYDWRVSASTSAAMLNTKIEERWASNGNKQAVIVAHSMGGVVSSLYSQNFPHWKERIQNSIFMGSPLGGSYAVPVAVLGHHDLMNKLAWLSRNDNSFQFREMAASFPGLLDMLPNPAIFPDAADFYDSDKWPGKVRPDQKWLSQSKDLKKILRESPILEKTKLFISLTHGTLVDMPWSTDRTARVPGARNSKGDGTVPAASAYIPGVDSYQLHFEHGKLPKENEAISAVVNAILGDKIELAEISDSDIGGVIEEFDMSESLEESPPDEAIRKRFESGEIGYKEIEWLGSF